MSRTVLHTYLCERLQSARGLGWTMPESELPGLDQVVTGCDEARTASTPVMQQHPKSLDP